MLWRSILLGFLCFASTASAEVPCPEFCLFEFSSIHEKLAPFENQSVFLRGFMYQNEEGRFFLAGHPDVPSCCLGKPHTQQQQVLIEGLSVLPSRRRVVTLKGKVSRWETLDPFGHPISLLCLKEAQYKPLPNRHFSALFSFSVSLLLVGGLSGLWFRKSILSRDERLSDSMHGETPIL